MIGAQADLLRRAFARAVEAVSAEQVLPRHLPPPIDGETILFAAGKAAGAMADVASAMPIMRGLVVVPKGYEPRRVLAPGIEVIVAGHPVPNEASIEAAARALTLARSLGSGDRLLALVSGGGSALLAAPVAGLDLMTKQHIARALLASGATIAEMNVVRQCLSKIKGGRLAAAAASAEVVTLAVSDIPGDDVALIASGPTIASRTTCDDAREVLAQYKIDVSPGLLKAPPEIATGRAIIIARPADALAAAAACVREDGYRPIIIGDAVEGDAGALARADARRALMHHARGDRVALITGGEATVALPPSPPRGGRNLAYALTLAIALDGALGITALAADTDGIDGTSMAAGALVTPDTLGAMVARGIDPRQAAARHDVDKAFSSIDAMLITGPTRTNVNDLRIILVDPLTH